MARPKKIEIASELVAPSLEVVVEEVVPTLPPLLSVDYASEGLNNMARTINEILAVLRYGK